MHATELAPRCAVLSNAIPKFPLGPLELGRLGFLLILETEQLCRASHCTFADCAVPWRDLLSASSKAAVSGALARNWMLQPEYNLHRMVPVIFVACTTSFL